ncbi:MAG: DUF493 domain-containing protein [Kiritimatiellia bacterium]|jgi:putative lipoic acid-binding regulatory protein
MISPDPFADGTSHPELYPSLHHFRIIVDAANVPWEALQAALASREVTSPPAAGNLSSGGRYRTLQLSLIAHSRKELDQIHDELRCIPGVKMLL